MQDVYFFDTEAVGGLTSRLTADCQRLSNVIGNDINMILRNSLQVVFHFCSSRNCFLSLNRHLILV